MRGHWPARKSGTSPMSSKPIALTDDQMDHVLRIAEPLDPQLRSAFLGALAHALQSEPIVGDGLLYRLARELRRQFWSPPDLSKGNDVSKYR
jgi:hypothetical protein